MASHRGPDIDAQYGLPRRQVELLKLQAEQRAVRRREFLKLKTSPFMRMDEGAVFDPAFQRYMTMSVKHIEYFKETPKSALKGIAFLLPFLGLMYLVKNEREAKEQKYRTGQVAYRDRQFKFI